MSVPLCYYGSSEPLPARRVLRAGPLTAVYEAGDLRYVKVGGVEVCRRWYTAVRDHNWGTVPGAISDEVIEETAEWTRVRYTSTHQRDHIHFVWHADIFLQPGRISFQFEGEAKSTFLRNRIGFCVLHPPEVGRGQNATLWHPDYSKTETAFPDLIAPANPFHDLTALFHTTANGSVVRWRFEGDTFETEDQRNWIDASFKTFCTPLCRPYPVEVRAGQRLTQTVTLMVVTPPPPGNCVPAATPNHLLARRASEGQAGDARLGCPRPDHRTQQRFGPRSRVGLTGGSASPSRGAGTAGVGSVVRLPAIGLSLVPPPTQHECSLLSLLRPHHLLAEVHRGTRGWVARWQQAVVTAEGLNTLLGPAVYLSEGVSPVPSLPCVQRIRVHQSDGWAAPPELISSVRRLLPGHEVIAGTQANFTELNRNRPPIDLLDGVCYSIQPQEHAFDNASLIECCAAIADTVRTARSFCGDRPLSVGPITLRKRVNPYATGPWEPPPPDPRQPTLFGAAWTLGALKYLAESGVASATFYETTGPRGVMDAGRVFPLFHVLADATEWAGAEVVKCESSEPLTFDALMLKRGADTRVMLANMTAEPQTVSLDGLPDEVRVRTLDESTFEFAGTDPVAFRQQIGDTLPTTGGRLTLSLRPYAYARLDG